MTRKLLRILSSLAAGLALVVGLSPAWAQLGDPKAAPSSRPSGHVGTGPDTESRDENDSSRDTDTRDSTGISRNETGESRTTRPGSARSEAARDQSSGSRSSGGVTTGSSIRDNTPGSTQRVPGTSRYTRDNYAEDDDDQQYSSDRYSTRERSDSSFRSDRSSRDASRTTRSDEDGERFSREDDSRDSDRSRDTSRTTSRDESDHREGTSAEDRSSRSRDTARDSDREDRFSRDTEKDEDRSFSRDTARDSSRDTSRDSRDRSSRDTSEDEEDRFSSQRDTRDEDRFSRESRDDEDRFSSRDTRRDSRSFSRDTDTDRFSDRERDFSSRDDERFSNSRDVDRRDFDREDTREDLRDTARDVRDTVRDVRDSARDTVRDVREGVRDVRENWRDSRSSSRSDFDVSTVRSADVGLWFQRDTSDGLVISDVGSSAAISRVGFREGDRIVSVNGTRVRSEREFIRYLFDEDIRNERVAVVVYRDGRQQTLYVMPSILVEQYTTVESDPLERFGVVLDDRYYDRIVVWKVMPRTPAYYAGIRAGDVIGTFNGTRVSRPQDLVQVMQRADGDVQLQVYRDQRWRSLDADLASVQTTGSRRTSYRPEFDGGAQVDVERPNELREQRIEERREDRIEGARPGVLPRGGILPRGGLLPRR